MMMHPTPWRVERDWAYEVVAADDVVVAKFATRRDAQSLCDFVNDIAPPPQPMTPEELDEVARLLGPG